VVNYYKYLTNIKTVFCFDLGAQSQQQNQGSSQENEALRKLRPPQQQQHQVQQNPHQQVNRKPRRTDLLSCT